MQAFQPSILARDDTFFGVCHALGEDFGLNPLFLRLGFALLLFFSPVAAVGGYAAAGVIVAVSRLLVPNPRVAIAYAPFEAETAKPASAEAIDQMELALAA